MIFATATALFAAIVGKSYGYTPEALADQVVNLPGAEALNLQFNQFSGYLPVEETKQMHYWFVESMNDPANDPIAFWTNGGPGCSGLLGFLTEQGPFFPNADGTLRANDYAWNKISNMVFIEAPCGVGFSYSSSGDKEDYTHDDESTAADNYALIQSFLTRFPEYAQNKLYLSSESYGGHYIPTLAKKIVDENTAGTNPKLNFKGFAVGNPFTEVYSGMPAMLETYWGHQMIAAPIWETYQSECVKAKIPNITICELLFYDMYLGVGNINPYAIDYPVCTDATRAAGRFQRYAFLDNLLADFNPELRAAILKDADYEPCEEDYSTAWLNLPEVKAAIHVKDDITWSMCARGRPFKYAQTDSKNSMVPIYQYLIDGGYDLDIIVFSGDNDAVCATIGAQHWIWDLGYEVDGRIYQTWDVSGQLGGYSTKFSKQKFGFVTVHGAGHEVPAYKPEAALVLWQKYLDGEWTN